MSVLVVGLNHKGAPLELLERVSFDQADLPKALRAVRDADAVREAVILSTCNRVEVYAAVDGFHAGMTAVKRFLSEYHHVPLDAISGAASTLYEQDAIRHLFAVAAGIESMIVGEPQILTQVRRAYADAAAERATGWLLSGLFRRAIGVGRRARAETRIETSAAGLADAGTLLARDALGSFDGRTVLIVGAGAMGDLAAEHIAREGARVLVANRTPARAERLAERVGGEAIAMHGVGAAVARADLVLATTGSPHPVITLEHVQAAMTVRPQRRLVLLDLALPRDIEHAAGSVEGVVLKDLDDLRDAIAPDRGRLAEIEAVRAIIEDEVPRFEAWRRSRSLAPLIAALKDRGERVRDAKVQRAANVLARLGAADREAVEALSKAIVAELLHDPIAALKARAGTPEGDTLGRALRALWSLGDEAPPRDRPGDEGEA